MHWRRDGDGWSYERFGRWAPVRDDEPVVHVCYFEAEAYAAWAGRRLPTEAEWEKAARWDPATGRSRRYPWGDEDPTTAHANLGQRHLWPAPVGAYPAGVSPLGVHQLIGDVWEWTSTTFHGHPGFTAFPYREYSEVFFADDSECGAGRSAPTGRARDLPPRTTRSGGTSAASAAPRRPSRTVTQPSDGPMCRHLAVLDRR
jgi:iron(II)-dependent oxidoreductase